MRKEYNKPLLYIENFVANEFVANNCNVIITEKDKTDAMSCINPNHTRSSQHTVSGGRVTNVFTSDAVCGTIIQPGSPFSNFYTGIFGREYYYDNSVVYIFNDNNDHAKTDNPVTYGSGDNRCFGGYKTPASVSVEETFNPFSF